MENLNFLGSQNAAVRLDEIVSLLRVGRRLDAIKVYRAVTGASLSDAKAALERMEHAIRLNGMLVNVDPQLESVQPASTADVDPQSVLLAEMAQLLSQRQKIQAIKLYRERTGLGLADAKNAVDRIEQLMRTQGL